LTGEPGLGGQRGASQITDDLPPWMQINADIEGQKLEQIIQG